VGVVGIVEGCGEVLVEAGVVRADGVYDDTDESVSKYRKRGRKGGIFRSGGAGSAGSGGNVMISLEPVRRHKPRNWMA
jgi:hypothetical protein